MIKTKLSEKTTAVYCNNIDCTHCKPILGKYPKDGNGIKFGMCELEIINISRNGYCKDYEPIDIAEVYREAGDIKMEVGDKDDGEI